MVEFSFFETALGDISANAQSLSQSKSVSQCSEGTFRLCAHSLLSVHLLPLKRAWLYLHSPFRSLLEPSILQASILLAPHGCLSSLYVFGTGEPRTEHSTWGVAFPALRGGGKVHFPAPAGSIHLRQLRTLLSFVVAGAHSISFLFTFMSTRTSWSFSAIIFARQLATNMYWCLV